MGTAGEAVGRQDRLNSSFPSKPIRFVVPAAAGGVPDVLARVLAERISPNIGHQILVEYLPGAGGVLAAERVKKAAPDGHTLLIADSAHYAIKPSVHADLPYDPLKDFIPVTLAAAPPIFMVANSAARISSLKALIALAKLHPEIAYGSSGNGAPNHLAMELFKSMAGVNLKHAPYEGLSPLVTGLLKGEVSVAFVGLPSIQAHAKSGKLRILAVATAKRQSLAPEIETIAELGVSGFEINLSLGFLAPAGTPLGIVNQLNEQIVRALRVPEVRGRLLLSGIEPVGSGPREFAETIRAEMQRFRLSVRTAGISGEPG